MPFVAAVFGVAGLVKGGLGLGLPPIAMGLLVLAMPPVEAASLLVLPSFLTNVWQAASGPHLLRLLRRLWPVLALSALATLAGIGWLADGAPDLAIGALGLILCAYAAVSLTRPPWRFGARVEPWLGPLSGAFTGVATAGTGVSAMPIVPYLQAIGLGKDELIQAMGLSFTVSALALGLNLAMSGALSLSLGGPVLVAVAAVLAGVALGARVRRRIKEDSFRRLFLVGLLLLGGYLAMRSIAALA